MAKDAALTPLAVMVLALLREGDMHPYEMIRLLRHRRADRMVTFTNGTFYHTVARLERDGLIAEVGVDREGNRPERTTYTLQDEGTEAVAGWVRMHLGNGARSPDLRVALAEAHNLERAEVVALMTTRRSELSAELETLEAGLAYVERMQIADQFVVEVDRQAALVAADLAWTDSFLERLARPDFLWGITDLPPRHRDAHLALRKAAQQ
ncbi:PadR family transcriptional regulator [Microbacterium terrisoli]|uniref:PadR family transcriptional regulator n=1 Tax=Microbacterium terrisoli TaxID=3242192 RepID=UPI002803DF10|nr:PadR family transcriptional regulator [Microbacterium protaetiae]